MDIEIVNILKKYGCAFMETENKEMLEEIETLIKNKSAEQLRLCGVGVRSEQLKEEDKDVPFDDYIKKYFEEPKVELTYKSKKNRNVMTESELIKYYKRAMCL